MRWLGGHVERGFEPIAREIERQLRKTGGGAAVCAYHEGRCVLDLWGGARDAAGAAWERDTMAVSYSTTKGVVATALHVLADRGLLDYDAPVARYWPEFAQAGKASITVRALLSHRAGLFNVRAMIDDAKRLLDWEHMVEALAAARPEPLPEQASAYHALTFGHLVGELVRRVSGRSLQAFIADEIAGPLGLDGLYIGAPERELHRAASLVRAGKARGEAAQGSAQRRAGQRRRAVFSVVERVLRAAGHPFRVERVEGALAPRGIGQLDFSSPSFLRACVPSANGLFTARSLARLYAALAGGGALEGVRLMSPQTVARATEIQVRGFDEVIIFRMRWRLGYHRIGTLRGVPRRAFGHFGWGGSGAWADPTRNLSFAYVVNAGTGTPIGDLRILRLNTLLLDCVRTRRAGAKAARPRSRWPQIW